MFTVGQEVTVGSGSYEVLNSGYYNRHSTVKEGAVGIITRVYNTKIHVRFDKNVMDTPGSSYSDQATVSVPIEEVASLDPNAPRPRKLGEVPKDGNHIAADDPRIMWLWDDIATYADRKSWCGTFDTLTAELSIPGRKRDVTLTLIVAEGIEAKTTIKARSPKEARDILVAQGLTVKN